MLLVAEHAHVLCAEIAIHPRMFEHSAANLSLFDIEPIVSFAEALISPACHVVHNNSFISHTGGGGISGWVSRTISFGVLV